MKIIITGSSGFIGTNAVEHFSTRGWDVRNVDIQKPTLAEQERFWVKGDLRDANGLKEIVKDFKPDYVLNLAAATGAHISGLSKEFFAANTAGVQNLIDAVAAAGTVRRTVFVSSLLVCRNGYIPKNELDYCPPNPYGESKMEGELIVRADTKLAGNWVIVRPTSVWGPWFRDSYKTFFQLISKGLYFHIGGARELIKPITFAGNTVHVFEKLLTGPGDAVNGRTFYVADYPEATVRQWAEAIQKEVKSPPIRSIPLGLVKVGALVGDLMKRAGWERAPLTSFRLQNIMTGGHYPIEATQNAVGPLPYSLEDGVKMTVEWMRRYSS